MYPGMFQALCRRRNIRIKYERYANALTASAVYNTNRGKQDDPVVRPFDFIMDDDQAAERERAIRFRKHVQKTIGSLPFNTSRATFLEKRRKVIEDLRVSGCSSPEQLFDQVWPHLKPTDGDLA